MVERVCGELAKDTAAIGIPIDRSRDSSGLWKEWRGRSRDVNTTNCLFLEIIYRGIG